MSFVPFFKLSKTFKINTTYRQQKNKAISSFLCKCAKIGHKQRQCQVFRCKTVELTKIVKTSDSETKKDTKEFLIKLRLPRF